RELASAELFIQPTWAPAADRIAVFRAGDPFEAVIFDVASGDEIVVELAGPPDSMAWSPDGERLAIREFERVVVVDVDGAVIAEAAMPLPEGASGGRPLLWHPGSELLAVMPTQDATFVLDVAGAGTNLGRPPDAEGTLGLRAWEGDVLVLVAPVRPPAPGWGIDTARAGAAWEPLDSREFATHNEADLDEARDLAGQPADATVQVEPLSPDGWVFVFGAGPTSAGSGLLQVTAAVAKHGDGFIVVDVPEGAVLEGNPWAFVLVD
ncbi:MAG: hypothetical protein WEC33_07490, partial [Dehalococcoidia bacterium]